MTWIQPGLWGPDDLRRSDKGSPSVLGVLSRNNELGEERKNIWFKERSLSKVTLNQNYVFFGLYFSCFRVD